MIEQYIQDNYLGDKYWFVDEVKKVDSQLRIMDTINKKMYLDGQHAILNRQAEYFNGKLFNPERLVLNYAKTIISYQVNYLMANNVTLTGGQDIVDKFNKIYRKGRYNQIDFDILDSVLKMGNAYEYVYLDDGIIKSKLIDPANAFPVWNHENKLVAFIEFYTYSAIDYYNVFYKDRVEKYTNEGGDVHLVGVYNNLSGLPIVYRNQNDTDPCYGRSLLDDITPILDLIEKISSKWVDSFHKFHSPLAVAQGRNLAENDGGINPDLVGGGINIELDGDFKLIAPNLDHRSFEATIKFLRQSLLDISNTPAVSMNQTDISNLSTVSIRLLFSLSDLAANGNERFMRKGIEERFDKIRKLLELQGVAIDDDMFDTLNIHFQFARPQNETEVIENLKVLKEIGGISLESMLSHNPYTNDVFQEMQRIEQEGKGLEIVDGDNEGLVKE